MIQRLLRTRGLEIRRVSPERREGTVYPEWRSALYSSNRPTDVLFAVAVVDCVDALGYSFVDQPDGSVHPYSRSIREILEGRSAVYDGSTLQEYYAGHHANTAFDLFPEEPHLVDYPPDTHLTPWAAGWNRGTYERRINRLSREYTGDDNRGAPNNPLFGPMDERQGAAEYIRLRRIAESVMASGFIVPRRRADEIQGVLLRRGEEMRFLVAAGKHRVAAMGVVAPEQTVPVRLRTAIPVEVRDSAYWPLVAAGIWRRETAERYFDRIVRRVGCFER